MKTLLLIGGLAMTLLHTHAENRVSLATENMPLPSSEFKLVDRRGDIALYERWFRYDSTTTAREIKVVLEAKADIQSAVNLLRDETRSRKWNLHSTQFRIVEENTNQWINYILYDLPWPISDHDCVLQYNLQMQSALICLILFESGSHESFPKNDKTSRLSDLRGQWSIEQQRESIHIEYSVTTMPSSVLPRWVTDPIIRDNLLDTMVKFRTHLEIK